MNLSLEDLANIQMQPLFTCMALAKTALVSCAFTSLSIKFQKLQ